MTQAPKQNSPWLPPDSLPQSLVAADFVLEPLHEDYAELDFIALMSCRARLRHELQWGEWPAEDFPIEMNRVDLRDHYGEFARGEAFAYTVLNPEHSKCLGCIYIERCDEIEGAQLAFWVIDEFMERETNLVAEALRWIHQDWEIDRVLIPLRETNARGVSMTHQLQLSPWQSDPNGPLAKHRCFLSERSANVSSPERP